LALGEKRKVNSTPTFVIGDQQVANALPYDQFKQLVDSALARSARAVPAASGDTAQTTTVGGAKGGKKAP